MKITLKKINVSATSDPKVGLGATIKWEFVERPGIYLCKEIETVLGLTNTAVGTKLELNIDKFCVIPPGGC
jgi:hypothetical protein